MKINMTAWIANVIQQKEVTAIPIMTHPGLEMTGNTVCEAVSDGEVHFRTVEALCGKYPSAAAATIMDNGS